MKAVSLKFPPMGLFCFGGKKVKISKEQEGEKVLREFKMYRPEEQS
jgi:hypothetical protein